jgi:hypothetical protein
VVKQLLLQASQDENRARLVKQTSGIVSLHPFVLFFLLRFLSYSSVQLSVREVKSIL